MIRQRYTDFVLVQGSPWRPEVTRRKVVISNLKLLCIVSYSVDASPFEQALPSSLVRCILYQLSSSATSICRSVFGVISGNKQQSILLCASINNVGDIFLLSEVANINVFKLLRVHKNWVLLWRGPNSSSSTPTHHKQASNDHGNNCNNDAKSDA